MLNFFIPIVLCAILKTNTDFKVPKITADYEVKCDNIYTYYLEQESVINLEEDFDAEKTEIDHISAADIQAMSPDTSIKFECPVLLQSGPIRSTKIQVPIAFLQTWTIIHHDDFESRNSLIGWNVPHRAYCQLKQKRLAEDEVENQSADHFIEPNCKAQQTTLSKSFSTTPKHSHIKVTAELSLFGNWNGDSITILVDGKIAWHQVFNANQTFEHPCPNLVSVGIPVLFTMEHETQSMDIQIQSSNNRHPCDGSYGVDDLIVYYKL